MKVGLYAGSFDPWSVGHQFVLEHALTIFDSIHVIVAVHPSKQSRLDAETRARLVAHAIDPFSNWWKTKSPFVAKERITVNTHDGLVADYAKSHNIQYLIRGLRSTTDFESEFNLYFANQAIDPLLQTWALMCPPKLLHCSSTYIRAVVGKSGIKFVGTSFTAQAIMLNQPRLIGQLFDLIMISKASQMSKIDYENFNEKLQLFFAALMQKKIKVSATHLKQIQEKLNKNLSDHRESQFYLDLFHSLKIGHIHGE